MPEFSVSRKCIKQFLSQSDDNIHPRFIIPDYQRPYQWDEEACETLWDDFVTFFHDKPNEQDVYFLGSIVTCRTSQGQEVIDGQQRMTTILLFLAACYRYIEKMHQGKEEITGLKEDIENCVWQIDKKTRKIDATQIYLTSDVISENKDSLRYILTNKDYKDNSQYYRNYIFFSQKLHELASADPALWVDLCMAFLERCVIFPIECTSQDSALTIFSTLNNRGLPLSDSDIFKAYIYRFRNTEDKKKLFTAQWKELNSTLDNDKSLSINDLFRFYTHCIRARNDDKSKEVGMRTFYTQKNSDVLKDEKTMVNLKRLADFWNSVMAREEDFLEPEAQRWIHCLTCYPNEYWKYITSVFVLKNYEQSGDDDNAAKNSIKRNLPAFLKKIIAYLFAMFVYRPTVNSIKDSIFEAYCNLWQEKEIRFPNPLDEKFTANMQDNARASSKISRPLILLYAYLQDGQELLPTNFQIEHIMPQKWKNVYYNGWDEKEAKDYLELFGNKAPIDKKSNIQAGNQYFVAKKETYGTCSNVELKGFAADENMTEWSKQEIGNRDDKFIQTIREFFETQLERENS